MKKLLILLIAFVLCSAVFAQDRLRVSGRVIDRLSEEPLIMAPVQIKELGIFTTTNLEGRFSFDAIPVGTYTFVISYLGYQTLEDSITIIRGVDNLVLRLDAQTLSLQTVEVVARQGTEMTSSSVINRQALEHVQPQSITDVMRLVPGFVSNRNDRGLMDAQMMNIRSISSNDVANAFGVAIVMDGVSINNDAGMLNNDPSRSSSITMATIDTRQLSTENIESVEIIRGIPSVEHANMTSGAVVIRTISAVTPYQVRFRTDPQSKMLSASRGFRIGQGRGGILNIGADYTNAIGSLVQRTEAFDRFNLNSSFSTNLMKDLTMNVRFMGNYSAMATQSDPDLKEINNWTRDESKSARLTVEGIYRPQNPLNILLDYTFSGSIAEQNFHSHLLNSSGVRTPFPTSKVPGFFEGAWIDMVNFYAEHITHGMPVDFQAKLVARSFLTFDNGMANRAIFGVEWNTGGNKGRGTEMRPFQTSRARNFNEIPFMHRFSMFAENKISLPIASTMLDLQAGARLNMIMPNEVFENYQLHSIGPSFNARYQLIDRRNALLNHLSVRGGWGMSYRMPNLQSLFPEPIYSDRILFSYNDLAADTLPYAFAMFETRRVNLEVGRDLKMPRTQNMEFGIDFAIRKITGSIAFFKERMSHSFDNIRMFTPYHGERFFAQDGSGNEFPSGNVFRRYRVDNNGNQVFFDTVDGRLRPIVQYLHHFGGGLPPQWRNLQTFPDSIFNSNNVLTNGLVSNKWGFEMTLNLGRINPLHTSIQIDASYFNISTTNSNVIGHLRGDATPQSRGTYTVQYFVGSNDVANVTIRDRLSSNLRFVTHIPKVGIVATLTAQVVFWEGARRRSDVNGQCVIYFWDTEGIYGEKGARMSGDIVYKDEHYIKFVNPIRFMDIQGNLRDWESWMETDKDFEYMRLRSSSPTSLRPVRNSSYMMWDLRISKDIRKNATISLFAENFLHLLGLSQNDITGWRTVNNPRPRFGAEVRMRF